MDRLMTHSDLVARGWTKKMVRDLIKPCKIPQHDGKHQMFYRMEQVNKIESTERYATYKKKASEVVDSIKVARNEGYQLPISVDVISLDRLFDEATRASVEDSYYQEFLSIVSMNKTINNEFIVNYLVNEHTNLNTYQKYNKNTKEVIVDRVFGLLKKEYPTLTKELDNEHKIRKNRCK